MKGGGLVPELPEVETVLRTILPNIQGKKVKEIKVFHPAVIAWPNSPEEFKENLLGQTIIGGARRGKYLIFNLSKRDKLVIHLRMTGILTYSCQEEDKQAKHTHLLINFSPEGSLAYNDLRRFGRFYLVGPQEEEQAGGLVNLGLDPLSAEFNFASFALKLKGKKGCLKGILLDQSFLAGLGNIYADEVLHYTKLNPATKANMLEEKDIKRLYSAIKEILQKAISYRGTTFSDYRDGQGQKGEFQDFLQVYGRAGKECFTCGEVLEKTKLVGRSSYYCPNCQPKL